MVVVRTNNNDVSAPRLSDQSVMGVKRVKRVS